MKHNLLELQTFHQSCVLNQIHAVSHFVSLDAEVTGQVSSLMASLPQPTHYSYSQAS